MKKQKEVCKLVKSWKAENEEDRTLQRELRASQKQAEADLYRAKESLDDAIEFLEGVETRRGKGFSSAEVLNARREVESLTKNVTDLEAINKEFLG